MNPENPQRDPWHPPLPETVPPPTVWPATLSLGACFLAWGVVTSWLISAVGAVLFILGCAGWVSDLRRDANRP